MANLIKTGQKKQGVGRAIKVATEHTSVVLLEPSGRAPSIPHGSPNPSSYPRASFFLENLKVGQEVSGGHPRVKPRAHPVGIDKSVPSGVSFTSDFFIFPDKDGGVGLGILGELPADVSRDVRNIDVFECKIVDSLLHAMERRAIDPARPSGSPVV